MPGLAFPASEDRDDYGSAGTLQGKKTTTTKTTTTTTTTTTNFIFNPARG